MNNEHFEKTICGKVLLINAVRGIMVEFSIVENTSDTDRKGQWNVQVSFTINTESINDKSLLLWGDVEELSAFDKFVKILLCGTDAERMRYHAVMQEYEEICWHHNETLSGNVVRND